MDVKKLFCKTEDILSVKPIEGAWLEIIPTKIDQSLFSKERKDFL